MLVSLSVPDMNDAKRGTLKIPPNHDDFLSGLLSNAKSFGTDLRSGKGQRIELYNTDVVKAPGLIPQDEFANNSA